MSYNISSVQMLSCHAYITMDALSGMLDLLKDLPDTCFLEGLFEQIMPGVERFEIKNISWYGEGSGGTYDDILKTRVLTKIVGSIEAVFIWEGGIASPAFE